MTARRAALFALLYAAALLLLAAASSPRRVGDGGEYLVMATRLAALERPSLTRAELDAAAASLRQLGSGFEASLLVYPRLVGRDGRQDFLHYWLYPLLAAPMVPVARASGLHVNWAFTFTNIILLAGSFFLVARHVAWPVVLAVFVSPIVWWVDKAHTEAFLFGAVSAAAAMARVSPGGAVLLYGLAGAQNAALGLTFPLFAGLVWTAGRPGARWRPHEWSAVAVAMLLVASPMLYTWQRLQTVSTMADYAELGWPSFRMLAAFLAEPNIGLLPSAPVYALVLIAPACRAVRRALPHWWLWGVLQVALVFVWSQNPNANHGGTPGLNRWVLSLLALGLPWLAGAYVEASKPARRVMTPLILAACIWSVAWHMPHRPEDYLRRTRLAQWLWGAGWVQITPPEVFAERTQRREPASVPAEDGGCALMLISDRQIPVHCVPPATALPAACEEPGSMCYALTHGGLTRFIPAASNGFFFVPAVPSWPASGPLASSVRRALLDAHPDQLRWTAETPSRWVVAATDVQLEVVLRQPDTLFVYVAQTANAPRLHLRVGSSATVTVQTLLPPAVVARETAVDGLVALALPARTPNLAVVVQTAPSVAPPPRP